MTGIKANWASDVKKLCISACAAGLLLSIVGQGAMPLAVAAEGELEVPPPPDSEVVMPEAAPEEPAPTPTAAAPETVTKPRVGSPEIEAKNYDIKVVRQSKSKKTYLFEKSTKSLPPPGRILLLKEGDEPVMALRVLKTWPDKDQFAAKQVKKYGTHEVLDAGHSYKAVEKIADIPPPALSSQDNADLKELEAGPLPGQPPPAGSENESTEEAKIVESQDEDDRVESLVIEETASVNDTPHWLSGQLGFLRNSSATGGSALLTGGGLRYGYSFSHMIFFQKPSFHDTLTAEAGVFFYKVLSYFTANDAFTIVPVVATLRYNMLLGETLGFFFYAGLMKNSVVSQIGATEADIALMSATFPAVGAGFLFQVGPNWEARVDLGLDIIGAGLVLRF